MTIETAPTATRQAWLDQGALPLPVAPDGTKRPAVKAWKQFQNPANRPTPEELGRLWRADSDGIGILCGAASGGIEMLVSMESGLEDRNNPTAPTPDTGRPCPSQWSPA